MVDLVVIGAGLAGLMGAYVAAEAGLRVRVIAKGMGATHWGAGTVDVLGYLPNADARQVERPLDSIVDLAVVRPQHPYAMLEATKLVDALDRFRKLTGKIGLPYGGADEVGENLRLPSPAGAVRPTFLAPQAQVPGTLQRPEPLLIVGFRGLRDFFPELIAANLRKQGYPARAAFLSLDLITSRRDSNPVHLAIELEQPACCTGLAKALKRLIEPGGRIGLPAILGMASHTEVLAGLQAEVDAPIFEIPTLPPSVPGIRLHTALCGHLASLGVRVDVGMEAISYHAENGRIAWVETQTSARPLKHRAKHFLLATGGILGGGLDGDHTGRLWEVVFDLPLTAPPQRSQWFRTEFLDPAGHPVFQAGVPVNRAFQPIDPAGSPVFSNVWAAGGLLAHADPIQERSLEGIAIATAVAAAEHIVKTNIDKEQTT